MWLEKKKPNKNTKLFFKTYYPMFYCWYIFCLFFFFKSVLNPTFQIYSNLSPNIKSSCLLKLTGVGEEKISNHPKGFSSPLTLSDLPPELRITAARGCQY